MDAAQTRPRSRPHPRAPSRSSTHTSASRITPVSATSSSSQVATSPQLSQSHPHSTHRHHHSQCSIGSPRAVSRPTPPLSRQESIESTRQPTVSSFLQEKLQRERKAEIEKFHQSQTSLSRPSPDLHASVELGRASSSALKTFAPEFNRPSSSAGHESRKAKKGHGVKEMEMVISTLHKQNFDLKLELYHRRERQNTLEERLHALESDKTRMEDINDRLLIELEKRDKAVEEAVAMIINLETKVDQLFRERSLVQRIENESLFCPRDYDLGYQTPVPQAAGSDTAKTADDARSVNRMPSFLSDHSETTENLRNVYLSGRASVLSLPRVAESSPGADHNRALGSPTPSLLSESSFVSVYGRKDTRTDMDQVDNTSMDETLVPDCRDSSLTGIPAENSMARGEACSVSSGRTTGSLTSSSGQYQSITNVMGASPLQRLNRLDTSFASAREPGQRQSQGRHNATVQFAPQDRRSGQGVTEPNKRDTLRKVLTDGPGGVGLHDHGMPPTPDTIASSTLRRLHGGSDETLLCGPDATHAHEGSSRTVAPPRGGQAEMESWASPGRLPMDSLFDHGGPLFGRPRSAGESTTSHQGGQGWDSDDDGDNESDTRSLQSSLDIWMREGAQSSRRETDRGSPDASTFPSTASQGSWAPESVMHGPGSVSAGSARPPPPSPPPAPPLGFDYMRDLFSLRQGLFSNTAPPPPNRRSSLHAGVRSSEGTSPHATDYQGSEQGSSSSAKRRSYHGRPENVDVGRGDDARTPVSRDQSAPPSPVPQAQAQAQAQAAQPGSEPKQRNNHRPLPGHQHGARAGLNRLFRRSAGATPVAPASESRAEDDSPETVKSHPSPAMGLPSWARRGSALEDDRSSATPPPIMLNPRQQRRNT
ncbi:hypothetical protein E4U41_000937, partial [Claviceps citrina]